MSQPTDETRIPIFALRLTVRGFARGLRKVTARAQNPLDLVNGRGDLSSAFILPMEVKEHRASYWVGPHGLELRGLKRSLDFFVPWGELAWLGLQTEEAPTLGVRSLNLVWAPRSQHDLEGRLPGMKHFRETAGYTGVLYRAPEVPQEYREQVVETMERWAPQLFVGDIEAPKA